VANVELVASGRTNDAIHWAVPEPVQESQFAADSSSWINGEIPVK
jgi:hypothetical protein